MEDPADMTKAMEDTAYAVSARWLSDALAVDLRKGLPDAEIADRRARFGPNSIETTQETSTWEILLNQFRGAVVWLLIFAAGISLWLGDAAEAAAIIVVLAVNTLIGFFTEARAVKSMAALRKLTHTSARVRRGGHETWVDAADLVPGDIVLLEAGDMVPADLRLFDATDVQADESTLTGESLPVAKSIEPLDRNVALADRRNMVFRGTSVTRGAATGITIATGQRTQLGEISELVAGAADGSSPLERRLDQLGRQLAVAALGISAVIAIAGFLTGRPAFEMLETGIAMAVAAVPEGLPIVATLALARGMWRMAANNVLINRLSAVETLGSANVLLTDKTGTLTENRMAVERIVFVDDEIEIATPPDRQTEPLAEALRVIALCNDASLGEAPDEDAGDPMELALLRAVVEMGGDPAELQAADPRTGSVAFDPDTKMMATLHGTAGPVRVKGAPEAVLSASSSVLTLEGSRDLEPSVRAAFEQRVEAAAQTGLRMLGLAMRADPSDGDEIYAGLCLIGFVGLRDPARADVPAALAECHRAGVRVVMVTGDHRVTAGKIAEDVGLVSTPPARIAADAALSETGEAHNAEELLRADVFARVPPREKLTLVDLHQRDGSVVAMTGDGVNDAPALRKADIGIAMGQRGTQVAIEASDVILRDDSFGAIVLAMREGRIIYDNIRAFIRYLFTCNLSEILLIALAMLAGLPIPLVPLQILFLNLLTDIFPAIALGLGEGPDNVMRVPPRRAGEDLITRRAWFSIAGDGLLISACCLAVFIHELDRVGADAASGAAFLTICIAQLAFVFAIYAPGESLVSSQVSRNRYVWLAVAFSSSLMLLGVFVPPLAAVLNIVPPDAMSWGLIVVGGIAPALLTGLRRVVFSGAKRPSRP